MRWLPLECGLWKSLYVLTSLTVCWVLLNEQCGGITCWIIQQCFFLLIFPLSFFSVFWSLVCVQGLSGEIGPRAQADKGYPSLWCSLWSKWRGERERHLKGLERHCVLPYIVKHLYYVFKNHCVSKKDHSSSFSFSLIYFYILRWWHCPGKFTSIQTTARHLSAYSLFWL